MKKLFILAFALAAFPAKAENVLVLKEKAVVSSENVTLNDLLVTPVAQGNAAIFAAPAPGETGTINVQRVIEAAESYSLPKIAQPDWRMIEIEREGRLVKSAEIENAIKERAMLEMHAKIENLDVTFNRDISDVSVEKNNSAPLQFSSYRFDQQSGRFEARLYIPGSPYLGENSPIIATGTLNEMVDAVQLSHTMSRGDIISKNDIALVRIKRQQMAMNALRHETDVVGMVAKRTLGENTFLRAGDVEKQRLISRNDMILVVYQTPVMTVTSRAKAMTDGAMGDVIEVQNLQSKHSLSATVSGSGQVTVTSLVPTRRVAELVTNDQ